MKQDPRKGIDYATKQDDIDHAIDNYSVLYIYVRFQRPQTKVGKEVMDGLVFTPGMIAEHLRWTDHDAEPDKDRVDRALKRLVKLRHLQYRMNKHGASFHLTDEGREWYVASNRRPQIFNGAAAQSWRDEALMGIDRRGRRSTIEDAVIPSGSTDGAHKSCDGALETYIQAWGVLRKISSDLGVSFDEAAEGAQSGKLIICRGVDGKQDAHGGRAHQGRKTCSACIKKQQRQSAKETK